MTNIIPFPTRDKPEEDKEDDDLLYLKIIRLDSGLPGIYWEEITSLGMDEVGWANKTRLQRAVALAELIARSLHTLDELIDMEIERENNQ